MSNKKTPSNIVHNKCAVDNTPNSSKKNIYNSYDSKTRSNNKGATNSGSSRSECISKTPISGFKNKYKVSTALNALKTPSSLYRSAGNTPNSSKPKFGTPISSTSKSKSKLEKTNINTIENNKNSLDIIKTSDKQSKDDAKLIKDGEPSNLIVAVRVRPLNIKECYKPYIFNTVHIEDNEVTVLAGTTADSSAGVSHCFQYDHAFWSSNCDDPHYANQETIFKCTGLQLVDKAFEGYNACLFAYGQTGSGKSYSMMGIDNDDSNIISMNSDAGIIPRFCHELFDRIGKLKDKYQAEVEVSYFEIFNEKIYDLLCVSNVDNLQNINNRNALRVREHPIWGPYVVDLSSHPVSTYTSIRNWLAVGNSQRATAATGMNDKSSRSHSILNIILKLTEYDDKNCLSTTNLKQTKRSKISLVDLAGSERINSFCINNERLREGVSINKSLLTLGKVIAALSDSKKESIFVPYRESVLTWLLRESLGGNSTTVMLATISPASIHLEETLATLRYACQARTIVNRVKINEDPQDKVIRELRAEIERLQAIRQDYERQKRLSDVKGTPRKIIIESSIDENKFESLKVQLAQNEKELAEAQKSWMERLNHSEEVRKSEVRMLKRKGLALELTAKNNQPCLINLAADPQLSGILLYILPPGKVKIGRKVSSAFSQPDIILEGPLVACSHCSIENKNGELFLEPDNEDFETFRNGDLVKKKQQLFHGDRLIIGGLHYFRVSNPNCHKKNVNVVVDYQLAYQEILQKQGEKAAEKLRAKCDEYERKYQEKLELFELEKFKYICSKELLESENKVLKENENNISKFEYIPHKSTVLDDIKRIIQNPSEESLNEIQLMVKEATQRCRELGLLYEFNQLQTLDEFGIFKTVIVITDEKNKRKAEWPIARLGFWLNTIKSSNIKAENIFNPVDIEWMELNESNTQSSNNSLNSNRISLNVNSVKEALFKQKSGSTIQKLRNVFSLKENDSEEKQNLMSEFSNFQNTKKKLTYEDDIDNSLTIVNNPDFNSRANLLVFNISNSTLKLKKLCEKHKNNENSNESHIKIQRVQKSLEQIEFVLNDLKDVLSQQNISVTPNKTPKSVRFLLD